MRTIRRHIIHASATPNTMDVGAREIDRWHKEKGWAGLGYHFVIRRNGVVETGRPIYKIGAHVAGHNKDSIGTCLIGAGLSLNDFTEAQKAALRRIDAQIKCDFPHVTTHGHREYANKSCPGFNIKDFPWEEPQQPKQERPTWRARALRYLGLK